LEYYAGRIYGASKNILWFSDALRFGLYSPAKNLFLFPENITVVKAVMDGLYVVAGKTYFLAGADAVDMRQVVVSEYGAVPGTAITLPTKEVAWFSENGLCYGKPGGAIEYVMEKRVAVDTFSRGATLYRKQEGIEQVVSLMRGNDESNSLKVSDKAVAEVRRNGIVI